MTDDGLEEIDESALITAFLDARLLDLHTAMPCTVTAYDSATQTVTVQPAQNRSVSDGADPPNFISEAQPKLSDVRVAFPKCGKFTLSFPIEVGDSGVLIFAERSLGNFRSTGQPGDAGDLGMHTLDGAMFMPCDITDAGASASASATNMVIGSEAHGESRIEIKPSGGINLGAGATDGVLTKADFLAFLKAWSDAVVGGNDGGALMRTNTLITLAAPPYNLVPASTTGFSSTAIKAVR